MVDLGFEPRSDHIKARSGHIKARSGHIKARSGHIKEYEIGICCSSNKHTTFRSKSKDRLAQNQDDVSEWNDMFQ